MENTAKIDHVPRVQALVTFDCTSEVFSGANILGPSVNI